MTTTRPTTTVRRADQEEEPADVDPLGDRRAEPPPAPPRP
jgi:hypothetical protein